MLEWVYQKPPLTHIFIKWVTTGSFLLLIQRQSEGSYSSQGEKELEHCLMVKSLLFRCKYILHIIWKSRSRSLGIVQKDPMWSLLTMIKKPAWSKRSYGAMVKRKMRNTQPNNTDELKAAIKKTWSLVTLQQCYMVITSMSYQLMQ